MSFYNTILKNKDINIYQFFERVTYNNILKTLDKQNLNTFDFLILLSPRAEKFLEIMAQKAHHLTINYFGRSILLYAPLYLSNYCTNQCIYCGFNKKNNIHRKQLTFDKVKKEAVEISNTGLKHILILTGDAKKIASLKYLENCISILKKYFTSIAIEIYPLEINEYKKLIQAGVDSLTIYQETYNQALYKNLHIVGPKKDYIFRLDAAEKGCIAGMHSVNIGALLGLDEWRKEAFLTGLHARYLQNKFPKVDISISIPRIRPFKGNYKPACIVTDKNLIQFITAFRIFMPRSGLTISTRESSEFRNNVLRLGITKMSAGSKTSVGGHTENENNDNQFDISDERNVVEISNSLIEHGYQPLYKDWQPF